MKLKGPLKGPRKPAFGGAFYVKEHRGQLIVCKWPKKRGRGRHPTTKAQNEKFRQAQLAIIHMPARIQAFHSRVTTGTPLMPRDLLTAGMYGRVINPATPTDPRRYSLAARQDLSDNLDILGAVPGDIAVRGETGWTVTRSTQAGQQLISGPPGTPPSWQTIGSSGGAYTIIEDVVLPANLATYAFHEITLPANWLKLDILLRLPSNASGLLPQIMMNAAATPDHNVNMLGFGDSRPWDTDEFFNQDGFRTYVKGDFPLLGAFTINAEIYPAEGGATAGYFCRTHSHNLNYQGLCSGTWDNDAAAPLTKIGITSTSGVGLRAGSRITATALIP